MRTKRRGPDGIRPPHNFNDYFFFAAFFLAFFFAAIIVSFKVNLGIVQVRFAVRTPVARFFFERLTSLQHRSYQKSQKPHAVRQFYATVKKKCNTFVEKMLTTQTFSEFAATATMSVLRAEMLPAGALQHEMRVAITAEELLAPSVRKWFRARG